VKKHGVSSKDVKNMFDVADTSYGDDDGQISRQEFRDVMNAAGGAGVSPAWNKLYKTYASRVGTKRGTGGRGGGGARPAKRTRGKSKRVQERIDRQRMDRIAALSPDARAALARAEAKREQDVIARIDIGVFGKHSRSVGIEFLTQQNSKMPCASDLKRVTDSLGADPSSAIVTHEKKHTFLNEHQCNLLMKEVEFEWNRETSNKSSDYKLFLTESRLVELIGTNAADNIAKQMEGCYNKIIIRRCNEIGKCIQFHTDVSLRTMQIPLNDEIKDYVGARLCFVVDDALVYPKRVAGTATIHRNDVAHGVTTLVKGVRYGLFLLDDPSNKRTPN